jgi:hypothetical protein
MLGNKFQRKQLRNAYNEQDLITTVEGGDEHVKDIGLLT